MDWINQNRFKNWLIIALLILNLFTISIIWIQVFKSKEPVQTSTDSKQNESVLLMKKALNLDENQTKQLEKIRGEQIEQSKQYNDKMTSLKKQLAEELFNKTPDTTAANKMAKEIGELQSKVELIRFKHFNDLLDICNSEQKEKLKPILVELFGKKPPKDEMRIKRENTAAKEEKENGRSENKKGNNGEQDKKPLPTSEKVAKYAERLSLNDEQIKQVEEIITNSRKQGEKLKESGNVSKESLTQEKEKIKNEEDSKIMSILNQVQKAEFEKMINKRNNK